MRHRLVLVVVPLLAALSRAPSARAADASLFEQLGGLAGIEGIIGATIDRSLADPRIAWSFDNTNHERLKRLISQQVCHLSGGPCARRERGMGPAHRHLGLAEYHFNALVENLQDAMDEAGAPFRAQLRLLALLAPMKREIVAR
ncbi:MAG: group 1 truncated hemoglobin [Acetobacteraceae bacterium]|nr:group 1 truncated hemoglobin [Acetobacteraceae bacterium]